MRFLWVGIKHISPDVTPLAGLGDDGLPLERGVLPRMPRPRRMYAGVALPFHAPDFGRRRVGRKTEFSDLQVRQGSTGTLILATATRRIYTPRGLALIKDSKSVSERRWRWAQSRAFR